MPTTSAVPHPETSGAGSGLLAGGSLLLFASLFLHWYEPGRSAWTVFEVWDLVLATIAVLTLADALARQGFEFGSRRQERWPSLAGGATLVIVLFNLINHPPAAIGFGPMIGLWLALLSGALIIAGALLSDAGISVAIEVGGRRSSPRAESPDAPAGRDATPASGDRPVTPEPYDPNATIPLRGPRAGDPPSPE